ncbi:hypothetical protein [Paraburkholderia caffeinilytica]|uniref:hypothetical protein n=1 Tax=Paraburkholderia caffeinilytica TaxID=1761016 RepID=UPI0038BBBDDD
MDEPSSGARPDRFRYSVWCSQVSRRFENQTGGAMTDRIISSKTHDAHMSVRDHIADGWVASVRIVPKGASTSNEFVIKLDTFFEHEDVAWESAETLARAELNNLK